MATNIDPDSPAVLTSLPISREAAEKREAILFAGVCHSPGAQEQMFCNFFVLALLAPALCAVGTLCTPLCIPLGVYCGKMAAESWRLYLTRSAIHYLDIGVCNFNNHMWNIPLKCIKEISADDDAHTVVIKMEPKDVYRYVPKPTSGNYDCIIIRHCENTSDFARAVKQQIAML